MQRHRWIFYLTAFSICGAVAAADSPRSWLDAAVAAARSNVAVDQSAKAQAQAALTQAQAVQSEAQEQADTQALSVAQQAVQVAQAALERAETRLAQAQAVVADVERYARAPGTIDGAAVRLQGNVTITHGSASASESSRPTSVLHDGDEVTTGSGTAEFFYKDGSSVVLAPQTVYRVEHMSAVRAAYYLIRGEIHEVSHGFSVRTPTAVLGVLGQNTTRTIRTGCCVAAVRGTSFDMRTDDANTLHVDLYEGRIDLGAPVASAAGKTGCSTATGAGKIHVTCGTAPSALHYKLRTGSVTLTTLTRACEFTITAGGSDVVITHGTVLLDAGERAPPAHGWWNDGT